MSKWFLKKLLNSRIHVSGEISWLNAQQLSEKFKEKSIKTAAGEKEEDKSSMFLKREKRYNEHKFSCI